MIDGILNVDKPLGLTSHDVVAQIRRMARQRRVGHTGTLDPLATGVLVVCLGRATRVSQYLMNSTKRYRATLHLGISTTTHDAEGQVTAERAVDIARPEFGRILDQFTGHIDQVPPMHSAIKQNGKKLYQLARRGITVERPPREVDIYAIHVTRWTPPLVQIEVECGPGTYIRALARDIGQAAGCGAHLAALRRTQSGQFSVEQAISLAQLAQTFADHTVEQWLYPLDTAFHALPSLHLDERAAAKLTFGQPIPFAGEQNVGRRARAYGPNDQFIALVDQDCENEQWKPIQVFADARTDRRS